MRDAADGLAALDHDRRRRRGLVRAVRAAGPDDHDGDDDHYDRDAEKHQALVTGHVRAPLPVQDDAASSHNAMHVKLTMIASIQYCERIACRGERNTTIARSCARTSPPTWPMSSAATWTSQMPLA